MTELESLKNAGIDPAEPLAKYLYCRASKRKEGFLLTSEAYRRWEEEPPEVRDQWQAVAQDAVRYLDAPPPVLLCQALSAAEDDE